MYATACFAIKHGIFPWEYKVVRNSLLTCARDHVALVAREEARYLSALVGAGRGGKPLIEQRELLAQVRDHVRANPQEIIDITAGGGIGGPFRRPC